MLSCKQISQLASESLDKKLPLKDRMQLFMHLAMCGLCARFRKGIVRLHKDAKKCAEEIEEGRLVDEKLSETARVRIQSAMDSSSH